MGRSLTTRSTLLFAAAGTAVWLVVMRYMYQTSYEELAITGAIYFVIIFGTMTMTNRMTGALTRRVEAREALKRAELRVRDRDSERQLSIDVGCLLGGHTTAAVENESEGRAA